MSALFGGTPQLPPPAPITPPKPPPTPVDPAIAKARDKSKQQAALAEGRDKTILTSGLGLTDAAPSGTKKIVLGS